MKFTGIGWGNENAKQANEELRKKGKYITGGYSNHYPAVAFNDFLRDEERHRNCWNPHCNKMAWLEDHCGWRWCFYHWWLNLRYDGGSFWYGFRKTKIYLGGKS